MKKLIREEIKHIRNNMTPSEVFRKGQKICNNFAETELYKNARVIAMYMPFKNEADTENILKLALSDKKRVCLPVTDGKEEIYLSEFFSGDEFIRGSFGIREPLIKRKIKTEEADLVLVPGIAFDKKGGRIGWGKGFYDRLLSSYKAILVGVSYEFQIVEKIETELHDIKMDYILTEGGLIDCE